MVPLKEELLVLHNEQRSTDAPSVRVDPYLPLSDVPHHGHLRHDDVHLPAESSERAHQMLRLTVDANPTTIDKYLCRTVKDKCDKRLLVYILYIILFIKGDYLLKVQCMYHSQQESITIFA